MGGSTVALCNSKVSTTQNIILFNSHSGRKSAPMIQEELKNAKIIE